MLNKQAKESSEKIARLVEKLENHPEVLDRLERIFQVVENESGEAMTADEAEELLVLEMRRLGQETLRGWAQRKETRLAVEYEGRRGIVKREKKR